MTCDDARDLMLEAEPDELRGEGSTALALHLGGCAACRALAERVLTHQAGLDRALAALAEARRAAPRAARSLRRLATWGLAAAAGLAALLLARPQAPENGGRPPAAGRVAPAAVEVDVSATPGRNAVVMKTADPTITIVWLFQEER